MKLVVVVIGNGRDFIHPTITSLAPNVSYPIQARLMIDDSPHTAWGVDLDARYPEWDIVHTGGIGMAGAVQAGFDLALSHDPDYTLWIEDDTELLRPLPIASAIAALEANEHLAQMCFPREPADPTEYPDQLTAIVNQSQLVEEHDDYTAYDFLFSMFPNLIPRRVMELGWPAGPIGVGNETGMTNRCLEAGYLFAAWGQPGGPAFCRHNGYAARGAGWQL